MKSSKEKLEKEFALKNKKLLSKINRFGWFVGYLSEDGFTEKQCRVMIEIFSKEIQKNYQINFNAVENSHQIFNKLTNKTIGYFMNEKNGTKSIWIVDDVELARIFPIIFKNDKAKHIKFDKKFKIAIFSDKITIGSDTSKEPACILTIS